MNNRNYTKNDLEYLKKNYSKLSPLALANNMNRTINAIEAKAKRMKLRPLYKGINYRGKSVINWQIKKDIWRKSFNNIDLNNWDDDGYFHGNLQNTGIHPIEMAHLRAVIECPVEEPLENTDCFICNYGPNGDIPICQEFEKEFNSKKNKVNI